MKTLSQFYASAITAGAAEGAVAGAPAAWFGGPPVLRPLPLFFPSSPISGVSPAALLLMAAPRACVRNASPRVLSITV
jgi:hypothetical protein